MTMGEPVTLKDMESKVGKQVAKIGMGKAMSKKWIEKKGENFTRIAENPQDDDKMNLAIYKMYPELEKHNEKVIG